MASEGLVQVEHSVRMAVRGPISAGDKVSIQLHGTDIQYPEPLTVQAGTMPGTYNFTCKNTTQRNLRVLPTGMIDRDGATGPLATWFLESHGDGKFSMYTLASLGRPNTSGGVNWYLGYKDGMWVGNTGRDATGQLTFISQASPPVAPFVDPLTPEQKEEFIANGFLIIRNVVPQEMIQNAMRRINHSIGTPEYSTLGDKAEFSTNVRQSDEIVAPIRFPQAFNIAQSLLGENNVVQPPQAQIALRFPSLRGHVDTEKKWHVDGLAKLPEGKYYPFSLLFGVCLSDQSVAGNGNLRVFPGSHFSLQAHYKASALQRIPLKTEDVNVGPEYHILLSPGDVVVVHPLTAHGVGLVLSTAIRYQLFYRMYHKKHDESKIELLDDLFLQYDGIRSLVAGRGLLK